MKSLAEHYSKEFRSRLSYFPAWMPGEDVSPGSVGVLKQGVFYPEGNVTDLLPGLSYEVRETSSTDSVSFFSDSGISINANASASHPVGVTGSARVSFSTADAVVFHAKNLTLVQVDGLSNLIQQISDRKDEWRKGNVFVSHVESAERYAVLISQSGGWDLEVTGDAPALGSLLLADASVSVRTVTGSGFWRFGGGAVTLRLYGFGWFGLGPRPLSFDSAAATPESLRFDEISPFDPAWD